MAAVDLAELRRLAGSYRASQAIYAMVALGVPDALAAGPASVTQIAASVGADRAAMTRLLRALGDLGILSREGDGRFGLTDASASLRSGDSAPGRLFESHLVGSARRAR
jgi:DNA-binding IclR family transcriptional regulator